MSISPTPVDSEMMPIDFAGAISTSFSPIAVGTFEMMWMVGMIAMMFPAMVPIMLYYNRVATKADPNPSRARAVGTPLFLLGYLAAYAGLGLVIFLMVFAIPSSLSGLGFLTSSSPLSVLALLAPGIVLIIVGVYQFSPFKSSSLLHCISPIAFFVLHSRGGLRGSLQMGLSHGKYCVGCCWPYMLVMVAVAAMSLPSMAILAAVIALEKVIVRGAVWYTRAVAIGFIVSGALVVFVTSISALLSLGL